MSGQQKEILTMEGFGSSLVEMQKNIDALQKNMNMLKETKDKLSSLSSSEGGLGGAMDSLMKKKGQ
jgi:prefoldin subunit 5